MTRGIAQPELALDKLLKVTKPGGIVVIEHYNHDARPYIPEALPVGRSRLITRRAGRGSRDPEERKLGVRIPTKFARRSNDQAVVSVVPHRRAASR